MPPEIQQGDRLKDLLKTIRSSDKSDTVVHKTFGILGSGSGNCPKGTDKTQNGEIISESRYSVAVSANARANYLKLSWIESNNYTITEKDKETWITVSPTTQKTNLINLTIAQRPGR